MKSLVLSLVLLSTSAFAGIQCPIGTKEADVCTSAPAAGDQQIAAEFAKKITVCSSVSKSFLVVEALGGQPQLMPVKVAHRMGGDSYTFDGGDVDLTLDIAKSVRPTADKSTKGKLNLVFKAAKLKASSTYKCQ